MDRTDNTNPSRTSNPREQLVSGERQNGYSGPVVPHSSSHLPLQSANHTNPPPPLPNLPNATSSATYAQPAVFANDDWEAHEAALILLSFSRQAFAESLEMTNSDTDVNQHETIADSSSNPDQLSTSAVHPSSSLQADSSPPGSEDYDSDETEYQHKIQHPEASSLEDPTSANMANIHESSSKEYTAEDRNKRPVPPWMPERQHYVDRSMTTTMTREELHDKEYQMDNYPGAAAMRKKAEEAEARSKPPPGELRIGQNKKFKREHRELEKSIGYPGGMPSIREESDNYMTRATGFFLEQGLQRSVLIPNSVEHSGINPEEHEAVEKHKMDGKNMNDNVKNDNRPKILKDLDPFNAPRSLESTISSDNEPETEIPAAPAKNKNSSSQRKRGRSGKLPRADVPGFNGTSQVLEDDKESSQQDSVSSVTQNDSSRAKKPKKEPGVTKALDSELGPFWAPQVGADGGRPKRKPNTNS